VAAYLRGASVSSLTLAQLQALTGTLTITTDGTCQDLGHDQPERCDELQQRGHDHRRRLHVAELRRLLRQRLRRLRLHEQHDRRELDDHVLHGHAGRPLNLRLADGAVTSQGAIAAVPGTFMTAITGITQDWASFFTTFDPDNGSGNAQKLLFAQWNNAQGNRYVYEAWDTDASPTATVPATTSLGALLAGSSISGTNLIYGVDYSKAAYQSGSIAAVDFTETNGSTNFAYRMQSGLTPDVTDLTTLTNLIANGYNAYSAVATANQNFQYMYPGSVSGPYLWLQDYVNQIWLNNALQLALMELLTSLKSIPYNVGGYALIRAACMDPINAAVNFGAIQPGVTLSALQVAEVNNAAGTKIDKTLSAQGWYLQIKDAAPITRGQRKSPPCVLWYMSGGSVNQIVLSSIDVE
jgi:hypothetical protein